MADVASQKSQQAPSTAKKSNMGSEVGSTKPAKKPSAKSVPSELTNGNDTNGTQAEDESQANGNGTQNGEHESHANGNGTQNGEDEEQTEDGSEAPATEAGTEVPAANEEEGTEAGNEKEGVDPANEQEGDEAANEEEGTEAIPAGSVDKNGDVIDDDGNKIGTVNGDKEKASELAGSMVDQEGDVLDDEGNVIGHADSVEEALKDAEPKQESEGTEKGEGEKGEGTEKGEGSQKPLEEGSEAVEKPEIKGPFGVQDQGEITNADGVVIGKLAEGKPQDLVGTSIQDIDAEGNLVNKSGSIVGKAELNPTIAGKEGSEANSKLEGEKPEVPEGEELPEGEKPEGELAEGELPEGEKPEGELAEGEVPEGEEKPEGELAEGEIPEGEEKPEGELAEGEVPEGEEAEAEPVDLSILKDKVVNKLGKVVDAEGNPFGVLVEGDAKKLAGKKVDAEGKIWDDSGNVLGRAELLPENERAAEPSSPFEDFPDSIVDSKGNVLFEEKIVGKVVEGDIKKLDGKKVDADGDILDKNGNVLGKAERVFEEEEVPEEVDPEDLSILEGKKVNKAGNVVDDNGKLFGKVVTGEVAKLVGKKCDAEGKIWSDSGKVIGTAELIPADDRDQESGAPFEDFLDAVLDSKGNLMYDEQIVGKLIEGDAKKLAGKKVDKDGEIVDKLGNVLGKCERYEEPDEPEAEKIDMSALAGKRVNKAGKLVDSNGQIYGILVEGDPKKLVGKMSDKNGDIWNDGGQVVGKAELVPESERQGEKEGPFAGFSSPVVTKDGKVADSAGSIIGRLIEGDAKKLYGHAVDPDGDVIDGNGNTLGKAERWEEEEKEKSQHPCFGRKVNKDGNVVDDSGDVIARLTEGEVAKCTGKEIDNDGDISNEKGTTLGHVTLIDDIPEEEVEEEEPTETEEEKEARLQKEQDQKLAGQMARVVNQSVDKIKPILQMINEHLDEAEKKPKEELDEQKVVDTVKPLIEEGGRILSECNGAIRGLDPDGRIAANAKGKAASGEASKEEYQLAEVLKDLTENVHKTIEQSKKRIAGMPHAKKELNPLWALLTEPLGQILAAVGLLLAGVLGLVGKLLGGLGLGGLLDNLLGGLGLKGILKGLGLGSVTGALTGK
ncbi:hypothetical protein LOCC1_G004807 [Lachnellula occidentalis]|uniref:DUF6987 domain-containing protein n=1 Tax=Lachnellula occidentalis TaxID=215460 RepID=A0A8H8UCH4_9HELO|nr:hypothetical protein LOCC1_G004807 [Lachnellula occidentalis]